MLKRTVESYEKCKPESMAKMSEAAIFYAFQDMRADVLTLQKQLTDAYELLRHIGYPRRGTEEETMNVHDFAELIQARYTLAKLTGEAE